MKKNQRWELKELLKKLNSMLDIAEKAPVLLDADEGLKNINTDQQLIQISQLLLVCKQLAVTYKELQYRSVLIALQLLPTVRNDQVLSAVVNHYPVGIEYIYVHICLTNLGLPDSRFDLMVDSFFNERGGDEKKIALEILEEIWLKKQWAPQNIDAALVKKTLADSALTETIDFTNVKTDDIHRLAISMFYAAAFSKNYRLFPGGKANIAENVEILLAICLEREAYETLAELLAGWALMGINWTPVASFSFNVLSMAVDNSQEELSYLGTPSLSFALALGMLYCACLKPAAAPYRKILSIPGKKVSAARFHQLLRLDEQEPSYWINYFKTLHEYEQEALSSFLLDVLLMRNIHQQRYQTVSQLLNLAYVLGIADSLVVMHAAEILHGHGSVS